MSHAISTIAVIRALTPAGARLLERQLGWFNPLPDQAEGILERIRFAIERAEYVADLSGKETSAPAELAALRREVEAAIAQISSSA